MSTYTPAEEVIDPAQPICDPHHHLWDRQGSRYLLDELLADTGAADAAGARHNVRSTVFVECASMYRADGPEAMRPVGETEFVNGIATMSASGGYGGTRVAAGIVAFADLCRGAAVRDVLEAHIAAARGRLRGIRHAAGWHASERIRNSHSNPVEHLLRDAAFRQGFAQLAPLGLSFDAWLYHPQLSELTELARAFPDTTIVLDHFGGPLGIGPYEGQAEAVHAAWRRDIDALARCPNVVAKLGGLAMPINGFGWHRQARPPTSQELADAGARYYLHAIERFTPERCMFESNFPVDKVSCSYLVLWNSFKRLVADFSVADKAALFHDTAVRVYRLDRH
jgi:L-fuconolactonase